MKILLTNDDGYKAIGIKKLIEELVKFIPSNIEFMVVAPKVQQSAQSHSITLHSGLEVKKVDSILNNIPTYYVDGSPADCVSVSKNILGYDYDLVISGCNNGFNLGFDILYSGTVAAAREAVVNKKKGIAISCAIGEFDTLEYIKEVFRYIYDNQLLEKTNILNINLVRNAKGIKITKQGFSTYQSDYVKKEDGLYYALTQGETTTPNTDENSDWYTYKQNYISITPLTIDSTDYNFFDK